jgi:membrane protein implicated in regulation of membrane protease activity
MERDDLLLTVVLGVAVVGIAVLAAAVLTGNTILALIVIAIAAVGLVLLARDWLSERGQADSPQAAGYSRDDTDEHDSGTTMEADEFEPDVPYDEEGEETEPSQQAANNDGD